MKLYYMPGACPLAAHIVLEWIGAPFEIVEVKRNALKEPEYLRLNPAGVVPTLVDDDLVITENVAILQYLAETHPQARLTGDTPRARAKVNHWLGFLNSDVHQSFKPLFSPASFIDEEAQHAALAAHAKQKLRTLFALADAGLRDHDWLAGSTRCIADPYLYVLLRWARAKAIDLGGLDNLQGFFQRMHADAGVQAAEKAEGL
ncbi:MAG: glutathione S-transferase N-terminal domain-containing protein [Rhodanobacter sp.]